MKLAEPSRLLLVKLMVCCWAPSTCEVTCTAKSDWYLPGNMRSAISLRICASLAAWFWLTAKTMDLPISPLIGIAQGVFEEGLAEELVGGVGEERLLELALLVRLSCWSSPFVVLELRRRSPLRKAAGGDVAAGIDDGGIDEEAILHAIEQGVAEGRLAVLAAEGAVGVEQQAALDLARVPGGGLRPCRTS